LCKSQRCWYGRKADTPTAALPTLPFTHPALLGSVETSALTGAGIDELTQTIAGALLGGSPASTAGAHQLVTNPRHRDALDRAAARLQAAIAAWSSLPPDLIAGDLTTALNALGEITGEVVGDDLLDTIFSRFCIGK
ncbi:MAG: tRNA uridine-5-carboxymethylaminomethyl(34) synthesis GTPase MnmE, partial [Chloroflexaceae bacterium]|nr:tRNA uridine-5-carboxymethylaminomethyl(34) synthesis GTPase MnmE [Chloroflexaceae bacterium]